jgi:DNA-binding FrmR family transcriptional regulator
MSHSQEHRTESLVKRLIRIEGQVAGDPRRKRVR